MRSGTQVLISTSFAGMLASILEPWIRYKVKLWGLQYPGVEFPPDYAQQLQQLVVMCFTAGVGGSHMLILKLVEWWPAISASLGSRGVRIKIQDSSVPSILKIDPPPTV